MATSPARAQGESVRHTTDSAPARVRVGGVWFDNVTMEEAIERIDELVRSKRPAMVVTPNVDHVVRAQKSRGYANLVRRADLVLADGQPIVWVSRLLGTPLKERVAGSDLFPLLCEHVAGAGYRVFFLGGDPGAAEAARTVLQRRFPQLQVAGTYCPPLGFERSPKERRRAVEAVQAASPDILFVGLGSPKQEHWIAAHMRKYGPAVGIGVGISFSFLGGHVRRAPRWMQRAGLEWLHRLCMEPRRLWRRYLVNGWSFLPIVLRHVLRALFARCCGASCENQPRREFVQGTDLCENHTSASIELDDPLHRSHG